MIYGQTIKSLNEAFTNKSIDINQYYEELFKVLNKEQERLNCFVTITPNKPTSNNDSILCNIPIAFKDNCSTKGVRTTASSKMLENYVPIYNATIVEKLLSKGMVMVGKTSMDELAMGGTNLSALTGPVSNPFDVSRISGGSSGGSAALVASGAIPFAIGSDTGDSIRKPAAFCGIVGFKPTWGRISRYGVIPYASSLDHVGAFTRSVEDMAIVIEAMAGRDEHDLTSSELPVPNYLENLTTTVTGMKVANIKNISDCISDEEVYNNYFQTIKKLRELGCIVEDVEMDVELLRSILPVYTIISNAEATSNDACLDGINYGNRIEGTSSDDTMLQSRTESFSKNIKTRFTLGALALSSANQERVFRKAQRVRRLIVNQVNDILNTYDIILTPCSGGVAPKITSSNQVDRASDEYLILENHLALGNFAGLPSLTLPSGFKDGLPLGVNIMGKAFAEQTVLNISYALESVLPYKNQYKGGNK